MADFDIERFLEFPTIEDGALTCFGTAISADGSVVVGGVPSIVANSTGVGAAYVFHGTDYASTTTLTGSNAAAGDGFGYDVAISADGSTIAVGAPFRNGFGTVYVYTGQDWGTETIVEASTQAAGDGFGESVALSEDGSVLVVSARGRQGALVYSGSSYGTETELTPGLPDLGGVYAKEIRLGVDVSADGTIVVLASTDYGTPGQGDVYVCSGANWATATHLTQQAGPECRYGQQVSIAPNGTSVVTLGASTQAGPGSDQAIFIYTGSSYSAEEVVTADELGTGIGDSLSASDEDVIVTPGFAIVGGDVNSVGGDAGAYSLEAVDVTPDGELAAFGALDGIALVPIGLAGDGWGIVL